MTLNPHLISKINFSLKIFLLICILLAHQTFAGPEIKPAVNSIFEESPETYLAIKSALNRSVILNDPRSSGSAVFIGVNRNNIGVAITAAHTLRIGYKIEDTYIDLPLIDGIPRNKDAPESPLALLPKSFGKFFSDPAQTRQRLVLPIYIPKMGFSEIDDQYVNDFGLVLMGQPVDHQYRTITDYITNPENVNPAPSIKALKMGSPILGETVIVIGGQSFFNTDEALKAFKEMNKEKLKRSLPKFKEAYSISNVMDYDKGWSVCFENILNAPYDASVDFFIEGAAAKQGMSGGGVFNLSGELVGIITHVFMDETGDVVNARALRAEYIINSITDGAKNKEVIDTLLDLNLINSCQAYLK